MPRITIHSTGADERGWLLFELRLDGGDVLLKMNKPIIQGMNAEQTMEYWRVRKGNGFMDAEKARVVKQIGDGADPATVPIQLLTRAQVLPLAAKSLMNLMRSDEEDRLDRIRRASVHFAGYSDAQIANAVGWTEQQVAAARVKLMALVNASADLDHGNGELS